MKPQRRSALRRSVWLSLAMLIGCGSICLSEPTPVPEQPVGYAIFKDRYPNAPQPVEKASVRDGQFCLSVEEFMAGAQKIENRFTELEEQRTVLMADLALAQARKPKRFGWTLGCGPGIAPLVDGQGLTLDLVLSCNATWGFRIGGMR